MAQVTVQRFKDDRTQEYIIGKGWVVSVAYGGMVRTILFSEESKQWWDENVVPIFESADAHKAPIDLRTRQFDTEAPHRLESPPKVPTQRDREQIAAERAWWAENWEAADLDEPPPSGRGRVPQSVRDAYHEHKGMAVKNGNGTEEIREAVSKVKKTADKPVREDKPDKPLSSKPGQVVSSESKAKKNGRALKVGDEEFLAVYRQTGGEINAMVDALKGLTKAGIYSRVQRMRKVGQIPAKS